MFRSILAAAISAALVLPTLSAPAVAHDTGYAHRHDRDRVGSAVAIAGGLAALYLLKRQSDRRNEKREARRVDRREIWRDDRRDRRDVRRDGRLDDWRYDRRDRRHTRILPERCFRTFDTPRRGTVRGYSARCLQRRVDRPGSLPPQCISQVETYRGIRNLYSARCLRRAGWSSRAARR